MPARVRRSGDMNEPVNLRSRNVSLLVRHVKTAFFRLRVLPPPAAGPLVLARLDRACAWPAADAWISAIVQRVIRYVVLPDVPPHIVVGPVGERIHLHQLVAFVPLDLVQRRACDRLLPAQPRDPGVEAGERPF